MHAPDDTGQPRAGKFPGVILAVAGLISVLLGPFCYVMLLETPFLRNTGLIMWALMFDGLVISVIALAKDSRRSVKIISAVSAALIILSLIGFYGVAALPATSLASLETAPDFELLDDAGQRVSLHETLQKGPVLLVFYRGHW